MEMVVMLFAWRTQIEILTDKTLEQWSLDGVGKTYVALYIQTDCWLLFYMSLDVFLTGHLLIDYLFLDYCMSTQLNT
jgi:hypothetical protein